MATEYCFTVNGMRRTTTEKKSLLRYLRDDLHLFSVKDGCSEGACGTCTIIVDGVAVKACVLTTDKSVGRNIVTVEGLTEREQDAFVYAFGSKGSVQCGFCIPGMVMAGKALIDQNPDPTEEEIKYALRGNICRCTVIKRLSREFSLPQQFFEEMQRLTMTLKEENSTVSDREHSVSMCERKCLDTANIQTILLWMVWYIYLQYAANTLVQEC